MNTMMIECETRKKEVLKLLMKKVYPDLPSSTFYALILLCQAKGFGKNVLHFE